MEALRETAEGDGEKSACRCLDAVRYVVSAVMIVLIVAVTATAIKVVLRPDKLSLSVAGSSVYTRRFPSSREGDTLQFLFKLRAENPSGRARMYYFNITAYLFDNTTKPATESSSPSDDSLIFFQVDDDMDVPPMAFVEKIKLSTISRDPNYITARLFDALNRQGARIDDATMRVDGTLVTEIRSGYNTTPQLTTYYCRQLTVSPEDHMISQATSCTTW